MRALVALPLCAPRFACPGLRCLALGLAIVPWFAAQASTPDQPPSRTAAELLKTFAIDQSHWDQLADGRPLFDDELAVLMRCLFRSSQLPLAEVQRLAEQRTDLRTLQASPAKCRGEFFHLQGRLRAVELQLVPPDLKRAFDLAQYYRCRLDDQRLGPVVVYAREVPRQWHDGGRMNEPSGALAMFLKRLPDSSASPHAPGPSDKTAALPAFVSSRVAWYPDNLLGQLGMDVGLLDTVLNRTEITGEEREAFYQMLAAVGRAQSGQLLAAAQSELRQQGQSSCSVVPLFNQADDQLGRLVVLDGVARRAIKVVVDQPDLVARFGFDHYYELGLFTDDSQGNPLIFCVRRLPPGMPPGDSGSYAYRVRVAGFFFKTWAYRSGEALASDKASARGRQLAPLLIGDEPRLELQAPLPRDPLGQALLIGLFLLGAAAATWAVWRTSRPKRRPPPPTTEVKPRFDF